MAAAGELKVSLPAGYLAFMAQTDGGEGVTPSGEYVQLWAASELVHCNRSYGLLPGDPRLVIIGSNGGGEAFALWYATSEPEVVRVPFIGAALNTIDRYAGTFDEWIRVLSQPEAQDPGGGRSW